MNYLTHQEESTPERVDFWLRELRTPDLLVRVAEKHPEAVAEARLDRPLLDCATREGLESSDLARALRAEEEAVRSENEAYWRPLKRELSRLRRELRRGTPSSGSETSGPGGGRPGGAAEGSG